MKYWMTCTLTLLLTIGACLLMFLMKYYVVKQEDELKKIHAQIYEDIRAIHMLEAEWATRNDPDRLAQLIAAETEWKPLASNQLLTDADLPVKRAPVPTSKPQFDPNDEEQP